MYQKHTLGDGSKQSKGRNPIERMERREQRKKARDWEEDGRKQVSYERADLLPRCQNKINLAALQAPLAGSACQSIKCPINMSEQTNQQKKKNFTKPTKQEDGWLDGCLGFEEDYLYGSVARDCGSVVAHFSLSQFTFALSVCKQRHSHAPAPTSQAEERLGDHVFAHAWSIL